MGRKRVPYLLIKILSLTNNILVRWFGCPGLFHLAVFVGVRHLCRPTECQKLPEGRTPTGISLHPKPDERALFGCLGALLHYVHPKPVRAGLCDAAGLRVRESVLSRGLEAAGKDAAAIGTDKKSAEWKIRIAAQLKQVQFHDWRVRTTLPRFSWRSKIA